MNNRAQRTEILLYSTPSSKLYAVLAYLCQNAYNWEQREYCVARSSLQNNSLVDAKLNPAFFPCLCFNLIFSFLISNHRVIFKYNISPQVM